MVSALGPVPEAVAANEVTKFLWIQATDEGNFINRLPAKTGQIGKDWEDFLKTKGEAIVNEMYGVNSREGLQGQRSMYQGREGSIRAVKFEDINQLAYKQRTGERRMAVAQKLIEKFVEGQTLKSWGRALSLGRGESSTGGL
ncbi:uncharacterized protein SPSC_01503 [Sporisorium scitamineum]|uniref:Uncharacterized protein n=1 Tax=Sporisorium scitamineum TaxID=49012 RepID=A0A127ZBP1_9BASI|nr:uncharacterized protein SPSC_01503 [Sporisorium scitamineum]